MSLNKTSIPALPELRVDMSRRDTLFKIESETMRAYIERMYEGHYKVVWTEENPHLLFVQMGLHMGFYIDKKRFVSKVQKLDSKNYFLIFWTAEPAPPHKVADYSFSYYPDTATNTWFPDMLNVLYEDFVALLDGKPTQRILTNKQTPKPNFCAFVHMQNPSSLNATELRGLTTIRTRKIPRLAQIEARNDFCVELMKYKKVLCPGPVMNNVQAPDYMQISRIEQEGDFTTGLIRYLSECRFFICFENTRSSKQEPNGIKYVTLKILAAFIAGSIPIYSGYREIAELFNPAAFINANDFSSHQELIEYIKEVDNSPELTAAYQNAPPILPDSPLHNLHPDKMKPAFLSLAERAFERARDTKPPIFQPWYLRRSYYATRFNIDLKIAKLMK